MGPHDFRPLRFGDEGSALCLLAKGAKRKMAFFAYGCGGPFTVGGGRPKTWADFESTAEISASATREGMMMLWKEGFEGLKERRIGRCRMRTAEIDGISSESAKGPP